MKSNAWTKSNENRRHFIGGSDAWTPTARSYRRNPDKVVARIKGYKNVKAYYAALWEALPKREQRELSAEFDVRLGRKVRSCNKPSAGRGRQHEHQARTSHRHGGPVDQGKAA